MENLSGLREFAKMIEERFGRTASTFLLGIVYLGIVGTIIGVLFKLIVIPIFDFTNTLFENPLSDGLQIDILPTIITLAILTILFFLLFSFRKLVTIFNKRVISQETIDQLAEMRSEGVGIYANEAKDENPEEIKAKYDEWNIKVQKLLRDNFTKAEELSFSRLGAIRSENYTHAMNDEHNQMLRCLHRQLNTLDDLITRHQDRH